MAPKADESDFKSFYAKTAALVDRYLESNLIHINAVPNVLTEAMRYTVFAGGKRLRAVLCALWFQELSDAVDNILPDAAAIELIHAFSLIHDDLPCMDDDDFRRGKPSNHKVYGEAVSLLAGDALSVAAFEWVAANGYGGADTALRCVRALGVATGACGMVGGQILDMAAEGKPGSIDDLLRIHAGKTGALFRASGVIGAIRGGGRDHQIEAARQYCDKLGLLFQVVDDLLDLEGNAEDLGKTPGKDAAAGKLTFPSVLGVTEAKRYADELMEAGLELAQKAVQAERLSALLHLARHRRS